MASSASLERAWPVPPWPVPLPVTMYGTSTASSDLTNRPIASSMRWSDAIELPDQLLTDLCSRELRMLLRDPRHRESPNGFGHVQGDARLLLTAHASVDGGLCRTGFRCGVEHVAEEYAPLVAILQIRWSRANTPERRLCSALLPPLPPRPPRKLKATLPGTLSWVHVPGVADARSRPRSPRDVLPRMATLRKTTRRSPTATKPLALVLKVRLRDVQAECWRRLVVDAAMTLD